MAGKNTAIFGIYPNYGGVEAGVQRLQTAGFRTEASRFYSQRTKVRRTLRTRKERRRRKEPRRVLEQER
jgi:hypothetical protein